MKYVCERKQEPLLTIDLNQHLGFEGTFTCSFHHYYITGAILHSGVKELNVWTSVGVQFVNSNELSGDVKLKIRFPKSHRSFWESK